MQGLCRQAATGPTQSAVAEASGYQQLFLCCYVSIRLSVFEAGLTITFSASMSQLHLAFLTPQAEEILCNESKTQVSTTACSHKQSHVLTSLRCPGQLSSCANQAATSRSAYWYMKAANMSSGESKPQTVLCSTHVLLLMAAERNYNEMGIK